MDRDRAGSGSKEPLGPLADRTHTVPPASQVIANHPGGGRPEGEPPGPTRLGGTHGAARDCPLDGEDAAVEVIGAQGGEFAPTRTGVGGQAYEQQILVGDEGVMQPAGARPSGKLSCLFGQGLGGPKELTHLLHCQMSPRARAGRSAHSEEGVRREQALGEGPGEGRAQHEPAG
jgi:hypothetical protein